MPSLGEAPSGGAKTFWLLLGRLPKVTRCKSGTISRRYLNNGYVPSPPKPQPKKKPHPAKETAKKIVEAFETNVQ